MMDVQKSYEPVDVEVKSSGNTTFRRRKIILCLGIVIILVIFLVGVPAVVLTPNESLYTICRTPECLRSAANLIQSMDRTEDPCNDFYQFACGRWAEHHQPKEGAITNNWFAETTTAVAEQIRDYLETNGSKTDPEAVNKARRLYRSCMNTERLDALGLAPLLAVAERMGLGAPPGTASPRRPDDASPGWQLERALVAVQRLLGLDVLLGAGIAPVATENNRNAITIASPSAESVLSRFSVLHDAPSKGEFLRAQDATRQLDDMTRRSRRSRRDVDVENVFRYMTHMLVLNWESWARSGEHGQREDPFLTQAKLEQIVVIVASILQLEASVFEIQGDINKTDSKAGVTPDLMTVEELQTELDEAANGTFRLNLTLYLQLLFEGQPQVQLRLDADAGLDRDLLQVYDRKYLRALAQLLASLSDRTLQDYLWWQVMNELVPYSNTMMKEMKENLLEAFHGIPIHLPRWRMCAGLVNKFMGLAVARFFYDGAALNRTRAQVEQMFEDIRWAFDERLDQLDWMDAATKAATREKAAAMDLLVGFPDWLRDAAALDEKYCEVTVNEDFLLESIINMSERIMSTYLGSLREEIDRKWIWEVASPMTTNAANFLNLNSVVIQAGVLRFPFFIHGLRVLDYGALGSVLGHELIHGFDSEGRKYDKKGNICQWWSNISVAEYTQRTQCFVKQYSDYVIEGTSEKVNGKKTLAENIADNGGLREAFHAYQRLKQRRGYDESKLLGLEQYNEDQLFFLSYANVWCEKGTKMSSLRDVLSEHSPKQIRVFAALVNSLEFAQVWKCPRGSRMNPVRDRCTIW